MKILLESVQTAGQFCMIEGIVQPGDAQPKYLYLREDESMLQVTGELEVTVGKPTFIPDTRPHLFCPARYSAPVA